jgi:hypothetical protein
MLFKRLYILIGLEKTNTAVQYGVQNLIELSVIEFKGLRVHETCECFGFFDECSKTVEKCVMQKYIYSEKS